MFGKKAFNAIVEFPDGKREVIPVQASSEWSVYLPQSVIDRDGKLLYAVEDKYSGLIEKLNQIRDKKVEKRRLGHSIFVERIIPENGQVYADIPSGTIVEVFESPDDSAKVILDGKYIASRDHFYHLSCSVK